MTERHRELIDACDKQKRKRDKYEKKRKEKDFEYFSLVEIIAKKILLSTSLFMILRNIWVFFWCVNFSLLNFLCVFSRKDRKLFSLPASLTFLFILLLLKSKLVKEIKLFAFESSKLERKGNNVEIQNLMPTNFGCLKKSRNRILLEALSWCTWNFEKRS